MDIDLRLTSGEPEKEEEEPNGVVNLLDNEEKLHNGDGVGGTMVGIEEKFHAEDDGGMISPAADLVGFKEDANLEPLAGMEFESHGEAYSFYQEYARSMGFTTAIQNSRRSKTSREFIDAKFACSRYGTKREYDKSCNRPRNRQGSKDPENASGRRSCGKTDCKASMHVKRRPDGKWIIHRFEKEHNHELLPAQAVSEQTRKMYAAMARQFAEYKNVVGLKNDSKNPFDKGRNLALEADRYEEEAKADSDTWNKQPALKSPSPFEKHVSSVYTHAVFKKFQVEVLGAVACIPRKEKQDETAITFRVQDFERNQEFTVTWNELKPEVVHLYIRVKRSSILQVNTEPDVMTVGAHDSLQQLDKLSSRPVTLDGYFGPQQSMQGMVQLNLMAPSRDNYYGNPQAIQGLGQLNSIAPNHDGYYGTPPTMHGLGQMDFFRTSGFPYGIREEPNVRSAQLHEDAPRHPESTSHLR
ncbi:hypothetical protein RJ639_010708 [Escallonia herrerae]|uniref:Protein FAR1-RELATED SEQUENCE n=1 Tax=Escallonia herrerae TaxID=1293975 RepID=A0AA89APL9_9ASTE|nr:hypothetical protein RJ639_010708 [Escallonia herrerae]